MEFNPTFTGEELAKVLLAVTGNRDKNVYIYDSNGKMRRITGITVQEINPEAIIIDTEELW